MCDVCDATVADLHRRDLAPDVVDDLSEAVRLECRLRDRWRHERRAVDDGTERRLRQSLSAPRARGASSS